LVRTRVGDFRLADALTLEELAEKGATALLSPAQMLSLPRYDLRPDRAKAFCNGLSTSDWHVKSLPAAFTVYADGQFLGIGTWDASMREVRAVKVYRV
ncbi:MAG: tRNA pseudouridine(55) synthase TruB, partial [Selenomonadaceae bacterium]|nr:tRNA pseudouridine(55) synthase TruB [Selenomonadaceae bacterium]